MKKKKIKTKTKPKLTPKRVAVPVSPVLRRPDPERAARLAAILKHDTMTAMRLSMKLKNSLDEALTELFKCLCYQGYDAPLKLQILKAQLDAKAKEAK